jgi:hypothetical protein
VEECASAVTVRAASERTGARPGTIRAAARRGSIRQVGVIEGGPYARDRWLLDYSSVMSWHRRLGRPDPAPADPLRLALDDVALDRALVVAALARLDAERARLIEERREWSLMSTRAAGPPRTPEDLVSAHEH